MGELEERGLLELWKDVSSWARALLLLVSVSLEIERGLAEDKGGGAGADTGGGTGAGAETVGGIGAGTVAGGGTGADTGAGAAVGGGNCAAAGGSGGGTGGGRAEVCTGTGVTEATGPEGVGTGTGADGLLLLLLLVVLSVEMGRVEAEAIPVSTTEASIAGLLSTVVTGAATKPLLDILRTRDG